MWVLERWRSIRLAFSLGIQLSAAREIRWHTKTIEDRDIDFLDCRGYCLNVISMTENKAIAEFFTRSRADNGDNYTDKRPENGRSIESSIKIPGLYTLKDGPLFKALQMEDKYDIYLFSQNLYFVRSWTGNLVIRANIDIETDGFRITGIEYDQSHFDEDFSRRALIYLIKSHIFDIIVPHPLPEKLPDKTRSIVLYSFNEFGRRGWYASYDDTSGLYGNERYGFPDYDTAIKP